MVKTRKRKLLTNITNSHGLVGKTVLNDTRTSRHVTLLAPDFVAEKKIFMQI